MDYKNNRYFSNWSHTYKCEPSYYAKPSSIQEIIDIISFCKKQNLNLRVFGSMLSPSNISMTNDFLLDMKNFNKLLDVDKNKLLVRVQSGFILGELIELLKTYGLAIPVIGSVTQQTLGGLISTAVHGTSLKHGTISSFVTGMRVLKSDGAVLDLSPGKQNDYFEAALVGIGCMGIIIDLTLKLEPLFYLRSIQTPVETDVLIDSIRSSAEINQYCRAWIIPHTGKSVLWKAEKIEISNTATNQTSKSYLKRSKF